MSEIETYAPGQFSWVDLLTPDAAAAARFYAALFGWSHLDTPNDEGRSYTQFSCRGHPVAGMGEMNDEMRATGMPAVWSSYVTVTDALATSARCRELGGGIDMPVMEIRAGGARVGSMAICSDPAGGRFSLWQPGEHKGAGFVNDPGSFCWNELLTRDVAAARRFYGPLFGWDFVRSQDDANEYWEIKNGERLNGGILPWRAEMGDIPQSWTVYFSVADCDETVKRAQELGGALVAGPVDIDPGRFAWVSDPAGAVSSVMYLRNPE